MNGDNIETVQRDWYNFENSNKDKVGITQIISNNLTKYYKVEETVEKYKDGPTFFYLCGILYEKKHILIKKFWLLKEKIKEEITQDIFMRL